MQQFFNTAFFNAAFFSVVLDIHHLLSLNRKVCSTNQCFTEESKSYRFGPTQRCINDDGIFIIQPIP